MEKSFGVTITFGLRVNDEIATDGKAVDLAVYINRDEF
jgi:hypothetical protein